MEGEVGGGVILFRSDGMLNKETLDQFVKKANQGRNQFCVRMYANNSFAKHQDKFNSIAMPWLYSENEAIEKSCLYKNFRDVVIPTLQQWRLLSVAKLTDPACSMKDIDKQNLSIAYIMEQLDDTQTKLYIQTKLDDQKEFIDSIMEYRRKLLAHNDLHRKPLGDIPPGIEKFFENMNEIVIEIKKHHPTLKDCNDLNLAYTEKLSEAGVNDIFEKITA